MIQNKGTPVFKVAKLTSALMLAFALSACASGGGGSGAGSSGGSPGQPGQPGGTDKWAPVSVNNPSYTAQLSGTGAKQAQAAGATGAGVTVGVIDSGVNVNNKALADKSIDQYRMQSDGSLAQIPGDAQIQDSSPTGHGTSMAQLIAGKATAEFQGGVATGATLVSVNATDEVDGVIWSNTIDNAVGFLSGQKGADIINISLGGGTGLMPISRSAGMDDAIARGTLLVVGTGNDSADQPSNRSLYPAVYSDAQKGVLAVTALSHDGSGNFNQQWSGANACGDAAAWCLSAPTDGRTLESEITDHWTGTGKPPIKASVGTSNATAMVSGVAALTKGTFSWMDNDNLRQTLLSTATYLADGTEIGGEKFNATFGWGRVNAEKAIKGPSGLHFGVFDAKVIGSSEFSNNITGTGSLIKDGGGTLIMSGTNNYTGNTTIKSGLLDIRGANAISHFDVLAGGEITGNGSVHSLTNAGVVRAGDTGSFTVDADYTQTANGTFIANKNNPLLVNGTADLSGTVDYRNYGYVSTTGTDTVIRAGTLVDNGVTVAAPIFLDVTHQAVGNELVANVRRIAAGTIEQLVSTSGDLSSAKQLDAAFSAANAIQAKLDNGGAVSNAEQQFLASMNSVQNIEHHTIAKAVSNSLSANSYTLMPGIILESQRLDTAAINSRLHKLPSTGTGVWGTTHHVRNRFQPDGYNQATTKLYGVQLGYDHQLTDYLVGGYASFTHATTDFTDQGGSMKTDKYGIGAYAKRNFGDAYAQIQGGFQYGDVSFKKLSIDGNQINAKPNAQSLNLAAEFGYGLDIADGLKLTPFVGATYDRVRLDAIDEQGSSSLGMSLGSKTLAETAANIGIRADWMLSKTVRLGMNYGYDRVLSRKNQDLNARFIAGDSFIIDTPDYSKGRHNLGLSVQALLGSNTTFAASYDRRFSSDSKSDMFFLGIKHSF